MKTFYFSFLFFISSIITYPQWFWQNPLPQGNSLNSVKFISSTDGWAVGNLGAILRTTNGGIDWTPQISGTTEQLIGVSFVNANNGWVVGHYGTILRTTDGGINWTQQTSGITNDLVGVSFVDASNGWVVGLGGTILKTTNGGSDWTPQISGTTSGFTKVTFIDENNGWVVGASGPGGIPKILRTTNGGTDWEQHSVATDQHILDVSFTDENNGTIVGVYFSTIIASGIFRTTNGGIDWVPQTSGISSRFYAVSFSDANNGWVVGERGTILRTTDGGTNWEQQSSGTSYYYKMLNAVFFTDVNNGTAVGQFDGKIFRTTNGGTDWIQYTSATTSTLNGVFFTDATNGCVVGYGGTILKTTNGGTDWAQQTSGTTSGLYGVSFTNLNTGIIVGSDGIILRTTNGGTDWTQQTSGTSSELYDVSFTNINIGTAVGSGGIILRTTNGGTDWTQQTSGTTSGFKKVTFIDANNGWTVGYHGIILRTTNGGTDWTQQTSGTTNNLYGVSFADANNGWVVGLGGTILRTTNGGTIWTEQTIVTTNNLYGVSFTDANNGWVVGNYGTILRTSTGGIAPTAPVVPTNLIAIGDTFFVNLSWTDNSDNETGFVIERKNGDSTSVNPYILIDTVSANETAYTDTGLTPNTTYTYRAFAFNNVGGSGYSNLAQATTTSLPATFQFTVSVFDGWNIVSIPGLHPVNQDVTTWWSGKDPSAGVFMYNGSYIPVTSVTPGQGYWIKHSGDKTYNTGDEWPANGILTVPHNALNRNAGWSLIGGYEYDAAVSGITTTPLGLQDSPVFGYSNGYQIVNFLIPGYGYWIKLSGAGSINLPSAFAKVTSTLAEYIKNDWGKIIITDATGKQYTLYAVNGEVNLKNYELPPAPPAEMFDVRYGSGRLAENISSGNQLIEMQGVVHPIKVRAENIGIRLQDASRSGVNERLKAGEEVVINNSAINKLIVSSDFIPETYSLEQNYPNPFNPTTKIEFSIPEDVNNVKLTIYNALGQKVAELVNSKMEAGKYSYVWNASDAATGLYIYELRTDKFVSVKKMLLLK